MLELKALRKTYQMGKQEVLALRKVSLTIEDGDFVAIMGPSGSGKSTLMHILGLLDVPSSGSYKIDGEEVSHFSEDQLAILRRKAIGFIFQQFNLLSRMSALENVSLPFLYSRQKIELRETEEAGTFLKRVGLGERTFHRPNELSGGQQQRVAIARSLINQPGMILADEPTGNLDSASEREILEILNDLNKQGITIIIVTHEEEVALQARRVIRMRDGEIQSDQRSKEKIAVKPAPQAQNSSPDPSARFRFVEIIEYLRQGFKTLAANKIRTGLSMLGILIGVAAVVAMLALGRGAQTAIESQLASLGSNLLVLRPGAVRVGGVAQETGATTRLTTEDALSLKDIRSVKGASPTVNGRGQVAFQNKNWSTQVMGTGASYPTMRASVPEIGRFFSESENQKRNRLAVIGATVVRELFGTQNPIGEMIKINKVNFQVIGILPEKGATGWRDQDDVVIIPVLTAMHRLLGKEYVDSIDIEVTDPTEITGAQDEILATIYSRHRVSASAQAQNAFELRNMADVQAALSESSRTMSMLLASIAAISLLVGGIGIMNIMLVSVTERTREIGLRKAIGARRKDILAQFLAESVVVSTIGGLLGILVGWVITVILSVGAGWSTSVSLSSVLLSFFFSASVGVVFGIYPARKASLLQPIEALRYE